MEDRSRISNMMHKILENIDTEEIRKKVENDIVFLTEIAEKEDLKELISKLMKFPNSVDVLKREWKMIYENSGNTLDVIGILGKDDTIRKDILENIPYLISHRGIETDYRLLEKLVKLEGGSEALVNNFNQLLEFCGKNVEFLVIPLLQTEIGRKKVRESFLDIKDAFFPNGHDLNTKGFFSFIKSLKGIEECKEIYEDYGFWADLYEQIKIPTPRTKFSFSELINGNKVNAMDSYRENIAELAKDIEFAIMAYSKDRQEKKMILQAVANGSEYRYKTCGTSRLIIQVGDQVVRMGSVRGKYEIPYSPRMMMPYFRKRYGDDSVLEVFNLGNTKSANITDEKLLEIYKELESTGIKWTDARKDNLLELTKDNNLPDYLKSKDFNIFGFLKDERYPTNNHKPLKKGDIVICDWEMLYAIDEPYCEEGILDDVIEKYLAKKQLEDYEDYEY